MIAIQKIGRSFLGALGYNLKKMDHADRKLRAILLDSNFSSFDTRTIMQEVNLLRSLKPNLNRYVYHTSINFSLDDLIDNKTMLAIAHDYLRLNGFNNNQYMIFRHHDSGHPHMHLLVNRITFDGNVVSDSNNYKKSEGILRELEHQYNLVSVEQSNHRAKERDSKVYPKLYNNVPAGQRSAISADLRNNVAKEQRNNKSTELHNSRAAEQSIPLKKAPTKNELEMVVRTGQPSDKMVLQELLLGLLKVPDITLYELIRQGEQKGISFLFNQASTGYISGITYFYNGFKITGKALGNQFKWSSIIKQINYEQVRDSAAISAANSRAKERYGDTGSGTGIVRTGGAGNAQPVSGQRENPGHARVDHPDTATADRGLAKDKEETTFLVDNDSTYPDPSDRYAGDTAWPQVSITDDIDDEAILGRNRRRQRKARQNTR